MNAKKYELREMVKTIALGRDTPFYKKTDVFFI